MTDEKYIRVLNRLMPIKNGNDRYRAARKAGFIPPTNTRNKPVNYFRITYLEFIRNNITKIEFFLL